VHQLSVLMVTFTGSNCGILSYLNVILPFNFLASYNNMSDLFQL